MQTVGFRGQGCINIGSTTVTNVPLWWGVLIIGKAMHVRGARIIRKNLYLSLNFAMNLKTTLKI